jgi:tetratricopeptide (TPR) repeat protein
MMKTKFFAALTALLLMASLPAAAQLGLAKVKGTVIGDDGKPLAGAYVEYKGKETGASYKFKTDKNGSYFSIAVQPGTYNIRLLAADGTTELTHINGRHIGLQGDNDENENLVNFNTQQERAETAKEGGQPAPTAEQRAEAEKVKAENAKVGNLNKMLADSKTAQDAGNYQQAVQILTDATTAAPDKDLLWARLGDAYLLWGKDKNTAKEDKAEKFTKSIDAYKKALALTGQPGQMTTSNKQLLASVYNSYADALARSGQSAEAAGTYDKAAEADPTNAGMYYFNEGATFFNTNKFPEAAKAFDKATQADPTKADAYYLKAAAQINQASMDKEGKISAPPGTAEAYQKYLDLQPTGPHAEEAKQMLVALGEKVQTSISNKKPKK